MNYSKGALRTPPNNHLTSHAYPSILAKSNASGGDMRSTMGDFGGDTPSERELGPSMFAKLANLSATRGRCAREIRGQYPLATPVTYAVAPIRTPRAGPTINLGLFLARKLHNFIPLSLYSNASKPIVSNFSLILTHYGRSRYSY
jgi:hypothetical protein